MIDKSKNLENFENSNLETNSITSKKSVDVIESEQNEHGVSNEFFLQDKKGEIIVNDSSDNINKDKKKKFDQTKFLDKIKEKTINFLKNKYNIAFLIILILALIIRLKFIGQESIWNDAAVHLWYAVKVTQEPFFLFSSDYIFGDYFVVQTLTAFIYALIKNIFLAGKMVAIIYGLLGITFIYLLGAKLKNKMTGLVAAALLAFNHIFLFYGVRPLADAPLTTMIIIVVYCAFMLEEKKNFMWGLLFLISLVLAMLTKKQAILFFVAYLIYLIIFKRKEALKKPFLVTWLVPIVLLAFAHLVGKLIYGRDILNKFFRILFSTGGTATGLDASKMLNWVLSPYLIPLIILGILLIFFYKNRVFYYSVVLFMFYWLYFEIGVNGGVLDRYILPLLPLGILFAAFFIDELSHFISKLIGKKWRSILVILVVVLLCWNYYNIADPLISGKSNSYAGHEEAGDWINENVPEDAIIFAGSPRMVRLFTERDFAGPNDSINPRSGDPLSWDQGGESLWYLRAGKYLENSSVFEEDLNVLNIGHDVYIEIDIWEYTQPSWYFPIQQASLDYFVSLGFEPVKFVEREVSTQQGPQNMPVIFIFKKDKIIS